MLYNRDNFTITTERLVLRLFQKMDAQAVANLCNNYNVYKSTLSLPYPYKTEHALSWIEQHYENFINDRYYEFAITDKDSKELYGGIALSNNKQFRHGELAYFIGEPFWGNGYATEAASAVVQFAFEEKGLHKVFARYFASNPASGKVMEKIGMVREGVLREHIIKDGHFEDLVYFAILHSENQ